MTEFQFNFTQNISPQDFLKSYYTKMASGGFSHSLSLFDPNSKCMFNNEGIDNPYNLLLKVISQGVSKFDFHKINASYLNTNSGILVNSVSLITPISFNGFNGDTVYISESFLIKSSSKPLISNYILKVIN